MLATIFQSDLPFIEIDMQFTPMFVIWINEIRNNKQNNVLLAYTFHQIFWFHETIMIISIPSFAYCNK